MISLVEFPMNNESVVVCCLVATSLLMMWHLKSLSQWGVVIVCDGDTRCTGMNVKVRKTRNKDQVPREKP